MVSVASQVTLATWICIVALGGGGLLAADLQQHSAVVIKSLPAAEQLLYREYELSSAVKPRVPLISRRLFIPANTTVSFGWQSIPSSVRYALFQAHSHVLPLILSYDAEPTPGNYVNSTNTGLIVLLSPSAQEASVYVRNDHRDDLETLLVLIANPWQDPVPGGCNLEFDVEVAPYLRLVYDRVRTTVDYQRSQQGSQRDDPAPKSCDQSMATLEYKVYWRFMKERDLSEEEYFAAIEEMLTVDDIGKATAIQRGSAQLGPLTRVQFTSNAGQGVVFNVIVTSLLNRSFGAAYTPVATYACDLSNDMDGCNNPIRPLGWIFCTICALVGLFLCFFGHRFFKTEMFIFGFLGGALLGFVIVAKYPDASYSVDFAVIILTGVVGGTCWTTFWWFAGVPVLSVLLVGLLLGFQLASVLFFTSFGQIESFQSDFNYGMTFSCFVMIPPLFTLCCLRKLSIVSCAVIGSYGAIIPADRYLGTSLVYIVLNVLKRASVPEFNRLNTATPFQDNDVILSASWALLASAGIVFQSVRERKRAPFPPPPYVMWRIATTAGFVPQHFRREEDVEDDERRPLLGRRSRTYQGMNNGAGPSTLPVVHPPSPELPLADEPRPSTADKVANSDNNQHS